MNVLFVCTGNTCRSPMAEVLLKEKAPQLHVQSAGIFAQPNEGANDNAIQVLKQRGLQLVHSSQPVTKKLLKWADIVFAMTETHKELLLDQFPKYKDKYFTLIEYTLDTTTAEESIDIADPFGGDISLYKKTLSELEQHIDAFITKTDA